MVMARKGRPRKEGHRHKCGKLRAVHDKGTDRIKAMKDRYGTHYNSALGRAFASDLLGDTAQERYQGAKRFMRIYARVIGGQAYRCPLDQTPRGSESIDFTITEQDRRDHDWLHAAMNSLDVAGLRPWLDQLISPIYIDADPPWLSRLLHGRRDPADTMVLNAAIKALDILAPPARATGIVSAHWNEAA
jgi:hypothetical protein